ncbi:MAG TPA: tRNA U-34 5-methylaminomethyl-2-thiouridine biosynthesis protein [Candidatus Poseidoniales archaeon]|nr:MAG TPA: tRNA U-34 5-methylaminomethyl-2-thiouridine biosynthesis protein [Candidatus Poseidoniales archaeon]
MMNIWPLRRTDSMGEIVLGTLAPHPPHLIYADNPEQNEPHSEGGWETLRWGYQKLARKLKNIDYDAIVVFTPHWQTYVGTHFLGLPEFKSKSVDPIFPNLFRFNYDLTVDVELATAMRNAAADDGIITKMMVNPDFRVDYGTITSCHLLNPEWNKPIVSISSNRNRHYYSVEVMNEQATALGKACLRAIEQSDKKVVLASSHSLSHRHFVEEAPLPEDMSREHIYNHSNYVWDMKIIDLMRQGKMKEVIDLMPEFTEQTISETDAGGLSWMMAAMGFPDYPAEIYGYQPVIGTGNLVAAWDPNEVTREVVL